MKTSLNFGILNEVIGRILSQKITLLNMESEMYILSESLFNSVIG